MPEESLKSSFESSLKGVRERVDNFGNKENGFVVKTDVSSSDEDDAVKKLEKLNELRSKGIISFDLIILSIEKLS
jgi:hypothetical protein